MRNTSRKQSKGLSTEEFTLLAIERLTKPGQVGIHTVYSGFNDAFRDWFPGKNPVTETQALAEAGKIDLRLARGGAVIYPPGRIPQVATGKTALKQMGLSK